jgi:hypothetical protein
MQNSLHLMPIDHPTILLSTIQAVMLQSVGRNPRAYHDVVDFVWSHLSRQFHERQGSANAKVDKN